jgi:hypothetical protein
LKGRRRLDQRRYQPQRPPGASRPNLESLNPQHLSSESHPNFHGMAAPITKKIVLSSGFPEIKTDFFRQSILEHGQKLVNADHLYRVTEEKVAGMSTIYGYCVPQTNVRKSAYRIELRLDEIRNVVGGNCTCVAGAGVTCKHSAALVCFVNSERDESKTAKACEWAKPSQKKLNLYPKGRSVDAIINNPRPVSPPTFRPLSDEAKAEMLAFHMEVDETDSMMFKTLTATVSNIHILTPTIYNCRFSHERSATRFV